MSDTEPTATPTMSTPAPALNSHISPPTKLQMSHDVVHQWKLWKQMWGNYSVISQLETQSGKYQTALFLHCIGAEALAIYNGFVFTNNEDKNDLSTIILKFDQRIIGDTNETFERYVFNERNQEAELGPIPVRNWICLPIPIPIPELELELNWLFPV